MLQLGIRAEDLHHTGQIMLGVLRERALEGVLHVSTLYFSSMSSGLPQESNKASPMAHLDATIPKIDVPTQSWTDTRHAWWLVSNRADD